ncbi:MAG: hypothetical protein KAI79_01185 [Bacteroidales bacterium]|nr:hypothetical protein [Bacteroidales bacterium]
MKAILEFDTSEPEQNRELKLAIKAEDMSIALWDIDQMFRNILKYENIAHEGYLTEEEYDVVEKLRKDFNDLLEERDIKMVLEG